METRDALTIIAAYAAHEETGLDIPDDLNRHYLHAHAHLLRRDLIDVRFCDGNGNKPMHMHVSSTEKLDAYMRTH